MPFPISPEVREVEEPVASPETPPAPGLWEVLVLGILGGVRGEERSAFREALRRALRRPVLPHQAMRLRIAAALLALLAMMVVTGCFLTSHFQPTVAAAYESARGIDQVGFGAWFARQMHVWCGRFAILLAGVTVLRMLVAADYKTRGRGKWIAAHLLLITLFAFFATGVRLPSGSAAVGATATLAELLRDVPFIGGLLRAALVEPEAVPQEVLTRSFVLHVVLLPWAMLFLVMIVHSTRTRPRPLSSARPWEKVEHAAPLWPDRALEGAVAVVVALGAAASASLAWPVPLGGPAGTGAPPGGAVDPVFRPLSGLVALFPRSSGSALAGAASAVILFSSGALAFFLLAFIDRSPDRAPGRRKAIVIAGCAWFAFCLALALLGEGKP